MISLRTYLYNYLFRLQVRYYIYVYTLLSQNYDNIGIWDLVILQIKIFKSKISLQSLINVNFLITIRYIKVKVSQVKFFDLFFWPVTWETLKLDNEFRYLRQFVIHVYTMLFGVIEYVWVIRYNLNGIHYIFFKQNFTLILQRFVIFKSNTSVYTSIHLFYLKLRFIFFPVLLTCCFTILLLDFLSINLLRQLTIWLVFGLIFFWLISGFNFFLKRYRFGKFTSSIQRFWKRTNTYFWLIEGFLFILFFYYYLNSSQEVYYMYDESNLNQTHLTSLVSFYFSSSLLAILIIYAAYLLHNLVNYTFSQLLLHLVLITVGIIYIFILETYQFYYIITLFFENTWVFDADINTWQLTFELPKIRVKQQYLLLAMIAKYWHFIFIFFSWLFLVTKSFEQRRVYYNLFTLNFQNLILLMLLNCLFISNWLKWVIRRYFDIVYYWFFVDFNNWASLNFADEIILFLLNFL